MTVPPLSLRGIYASLRAPTLRDVVYSSKALAASGFALAAGFALDLENPFWSVLTVYIIINPPGAGAIRSKAVFRLLGTLIGGVLVLAATALFADQIGILLTVTIGIVVGALFLNQIDRTPTGYIWFAVAVTAAVIALSNLSEPGRIFDLATARVGEISLGILITAAVDCVWPEPMTPAFIKALSDWRRQARDFAVDALQPFDRPSSEEDRRGKLRDLVKGIEIIDGKAIQLPFDVVARAPRRRDLDLVRHQVVATVADLVAIELRTRSLNGEGTVSVPTEELLHAVIGWVRADVDGGAETLDATVEKGRVLVVELQQASNDFDALGVHAVLVERGLLSRLADFTGDWCDLMLALRAVETGRRLPPRLEKEAARAKPIRCIDYLGTALNLAPLALALSVSSIIWYLTAWVNGPTALLFSFAGCIFLVGQGQILQSTAGFLACVLISFGLVFFYEFVVLPRVTDFPILIMVLGCALLPVGLLMAMSMAGMLVATLTFSFLGLQNAYVADFAQSLQTLVGSLVGLLIALICLRVCAYDHPRFAARRLASAVRRDVIDVARAVRLPDADRFRFLAFYRLSLYFAAAAQVADGGKLPRLGLLGDFGVGFNLLGLRRQQGMLSPGAREVIAELRNGTVAVFRGKLAGRVDDEALRILVDGAIDNPAIRNDPAHDVLLDHLTGLDLALGDRPRHERGPDR